MLLSVQHNLSKTQTVLFTLVSGVTCLYVGLLGLRLRAGVVWRGRGRGSSCPALTLLATVCTAHVRHVRHAGTRVSSPGVGDLELRCDVGGVMSRVTSPHLRHVTSCQVMSRVTCRHLHSCSSARTLVTVTRTRSNHLYRGSGANLENVNTGCNVNILSRHQHPATSQLHNLYFFISFFTRETGSKV